MSALEKNVNCQDIAPLLVFYVCEEVSDKERKQVEAHLASCEACSAQLAEERELQEIVAGGLQTADEFDSSGILLSQCRSASGPGSLAPVWMVAPLDGAAPGLERRTPGPLGNSAWHSGDSAAADPFQRRRKWSGDERHGQAANHRRPACENGGGGHQFFTCVGLCSRHCSASAQC